MASKRQSAGDIGGQRLPPGSGKGSDGTKGSDGSIVAPLMDTFHEAKIDPEGEAIHTRDAIDSFEARITGVGTRNVRKVAPRQQSSTTAPVTKKATGGPAHAAPKKSSHGPVAITRKVSKGEGPTEEQQDQSRERCEDLQRVRDLDTFKVPL